MTTDENVTLRDISQSLNEGRGPGWAIEHPQYGKWFITREAVIADWKKDYAEAYPDSSIPEPDAETIETWFAEQITWIEVAAHGAQLARPDMADVEAGFMRQMARDADYVAVLSNTTVTHIDNAPVAKALELAALQPNDVKLLSMVLAEVIRQIEDKAQLNCEPAVPKFDALELCRLRETIAL
jgi:hypothetical protein